jgi:hypothetical protein
MCVYCQPWHSIQNFMGQKLGQIDNATNKVNAKIAQETKRSVRQYRHLAEGRLAVKGSEVWCSVYLYT